MQRIASSSRFLVAAVGLALLLIRPAQAIAPLPTDAAEIADIAVASPSDLESLKEADADQDGLSDSDEVIFGSNPGEKDTDHDGYEDGIEIQSGHDPLKGNGVRLKKRIAISLASQTLTYSLGPKTLGTFPVSTGRPGHRTPVGTFTINNKIPRAWSRSAKLWMPYWMPFIGTLYGIHELPEWPGGKKEGENHLGIPVSGGCVRLGVGPAKTLYEWVEVGTEVAISKA